ncbi:dihydroorotase [Flavobacteriaceae bacterium MHTCC 0001]
MNILIKSATILDAKSDFHNTTQDILVENGCITNIGSNLKNPNKYQEIVLENLHVSQGWFDSSVSFGEPGFEERETISNGIKTAALSGFTSVALNPNTNPVIDTSSNVSFITSKAIHQAVNVLPIGTLTKGSKGEDLAELFDMHNVGAVAFYDYKKSISNPNLLKIALQYADNFGGLVCSFPQDNKMAGNGVVNEEVTSTSLGLKGIPALAEELQVSRDLFLLEYAGGKLHIPTISTAKSVALIREAKEKKLDVSCSVAIHNLYFIDESLTGFDSNFKVKPPLRTQNDVNALVEGVKDGTIDMVTTDHNPLDIELKKVEFDHAAYGTIGLESAFGALKHIFTTKKTIDILTRGKSRFGIENQPIAIGNTINATLFNPNSKYTFSKESIISKSHNAIFNGTTMKGNVYGIIANNVIVLKE